MRVAPIDALLNDYARVVGLFTTWKCDGSEVDAAKASITEAFEKLRETNQRLNRRVQSAEAGLAEKVNANAGVSFGRALANSAATMYASQLRDLQAALPSEEEVNFLYGIPIAPVCTPDCQVELDRICEKLRSLSSLRSSSLGEQK